VGLQAGRCHLATWPLLMASTLIMSGVASLS